jgi:HAD superfamily hydrolase (TIGR01490 family)
MGRMAGAAFFDLDRTLLRRSSSLALAGPFRRRGLITRRALVRAALWQVLFVARGAKPETVRRAAEQGLGVLRGMTTSELQTLVSESLEPVLRPLVYGEPVELARQHRARGEPVYIVSAALQEIVDELARDLEFDGAIGTLAEVVDGVYTGRTLAARHAEGKADAVRELAAAEGLELDASWAYSDSYSDLPFLEAVGHPVAVNPDRQLRRIASERGWPTMRFRTAHAA